MEENPELARGSKFVARDLVTSLWWKITDSLNSLGPPNRSVAAWQKVWNDKKLQLRRKLQHNKTELTATGGGPNSLHSFNDLEETIIRLLSLERAVIMGLFSVRSWHPVKHPVHLEWMKTKT
ncbi:uncharacterized protein LOC134208802 [Armigeres subalbatus]|uniref:uncharacterized protein LOC134208802 n=1 Tax=Armigeres subalbatus TaxID=124917 RepID=UPI002ED69DD7